MKTFPQLGMSESLSVRLKDLDIQLPPLHTNFIQLLLILSGERLLDKIYSRTDPVFNCPTDLS